MSLPAEKGSLLGRSAAVLIVVLFTLSGVGVAWALDPGLLQTDRVSVVVVGWDRALAHTTEELSNTLPFAGIERVSSVDSLLGAIGGGYGTLIVVGRGIEDGMLLAGETIPWAELGQILQGSPAHTFLLAACYSQALRTSLPERSFFGFSGLVDVDQAAFTMAALVYGLRGDFQKVREVLSTASSILWGKFFGISSHPMEHLSHDYHTKKIRDIWHVKYQESALYDVEYTHPDNYYHYTWVGPNTPFTRQGDNLFTAHIKRDDLTVSGWVAGIGAGLGAIGLAALAIPLAALILLAAGALAWLFIELVVKAEQGDGWQWIQNLGFAWWGLGFDWKLGSFQWVHFQQFFGIFTMWPLLYGGDLLGIDGW